MWRGQQHLQDKMIQDKKVGLKIKKLMAYLTSEDHDNS